MNNTRASDPITSVMAGEQALHFAGSHCDRIEVALRNEPGMTAKDIATTTGLSVEQVCRRLPEMEGKTAAVVQFEGDDLVRDGYRVWAAV